MILEPHKLMAIRDRCTATDFLHLTLMPTEACNFRCTYCYESFERGRMEPAVVEGVKNLIRRRIAELRSLYLSWFGGEPLLACDIIEDILREANRGLTRNPSLHLMSAITTNAALLDRTRLRSLLDLGVLRYQVTLDGPRSLHDRMRIAANGKGTFDRIWRNLRLMRDEPGEFTVTLRVHVSAENATELPVLVDDLADEFGGDPRFQLFVRALSCFGGRNDERLPVLSKERARELVRELEERGSDGGLVLFDLRRFDPFCYAARGNSWIVRADGRLNKCTLGLSEPSNQVGRLHPDGTLEIDRKLLRSWMRGVFSGDERALTCPQDGIRQRGEWSPVTFASVATSAWPRTRLAAAPHDTAPRRHELVSSRR